MRQGGEQCCRVGGLVRLLWQVWRCQGRHRCRRTHVWCKRATMHSTSLCLLPGGVRHHSQLQAWPSPHEIQRRHTHVNMWHWHTHANRWHTHVVQAHAHLQLAVGGLRVDPRGQRVTRRALRQALALPACLRREAVYADDQRVDVWLLAQPLLVGAAGHVQYVGAALVLARGELLVELRQGGSRGAG